MQVYDYNAYKWNHAISASNIAGVDPQVASELCDDYGVPWYTYGCPYTSGIKVYCESDELWKRIISESTF